MNVPVNSGDARGRPEWDGHVLLVHRCERERQAALTAWVRRGLDLGEKIYYTEPETAPDQCRLLTILSSAGIDARQAVTTGQITLLPPPEFYPPEGQLPLFEQGLSEGYPAVRVSAEVSVALTVRSLDWHNAAERAFEEASRSYPISAMCQHEADALSDDRLDEVVGMHSGGIRERLLSTAGSGDGLALTGEVDISNSKILASALRVATDNTRADNTRADNTRADNTNSRFRLDLSGISFIDASGARIIVQASEEYRLLGGHLDLIAARQCEWILRTLEVDQLPNVTLLRGEG